MMGDENDVVLIQRVIFHAAKALAAVCASCPRKVRHNERL